MSCSFDSKSNRWRNNETGRFTKRPTDPSELVKNGRVNKADIDAWASQGGIPNTCGNDPIKFPSGGFKYEAGSYTVHGHGANPSAAAKFPNSNVANGPTVSMKIFQLGRYLELMAHGVHLNQILMVLIFLLMVHLIDGISMNLQDIKNKVLSLPTVMDISEEILIINELMASEVDDLVKNKDVFRFIINSLELSHTDSGFMELTKENEGVFIAFYHWLREVNNRLNLNLNTNIIDSFSMTLEDVKKLMS